MARTLTATEDPRLGARLLTRTPLYYEAGADPHTDRPAHVRAGSALVRVGAQLAVVQDDANFIALFDVATRRVAPLVLPSGHGGLRQFDDHRGNKHHKLDLEACVAIGDEAGTTLLAFGSGTKRPREVVVRVRGFDGAAPDVRLVDAGPLYDLLRHETAFSGSELNLEGAVVVGDHLRLFQRGNGAPSGTLEPVNATCDLSLSALCAWLDAPHTDPPRLTRIVRYDLGAVDGVRLTFTDGATAPFGVAFLAAAEASPNAVDDGVVVGVAIGVTSEDGAQVATLRDTDGRRVTDKAEGLAFTSHDRAWIVVDADDPRRPCDLCEVLLTGPWSSC
jgi:hypothetical protein